MSFISTLVSSWIIKKVVFMLQNWCFLPVLSVAVIFRFRNINTYIKVIRGYWLFPTAYFIKKDKR